MKRLLILATLAVLTPVRRGLTLVEGRLVHAEYGLRHRTGALFLAFSVIALSACGGAERHARTALEVSAEALVATDTMVSSTYVRRAAEARDEASAAHPGPEGADAAEADYHDRMRSLDRAEAALRGVASTLYAAEAQVDAHEAEGYAVVGCVAVAFEHVLEALGPAGLDPPRQVRAAISAIRAIAPACEVSP